MVNRKRAEGNVHTLDADSLSPQLVGYLLSNSLTTVVHDDDRFMFHIFNIIEYSMKRGNVVSRQVAP